MADTTRLNEGLAVLAARVDELVAKAYAPPPDNQSEIDAAADAVQAIIARIPQPLS